MGFDKFKELFDNHYGSSISAFINSEEDYYDLEKCPFSYSKEEILDEISHDSYGSEDSDLKRVYYIDDFNIHVMFIGNRSSYQGEEWYSYHEVKQTEKTITVWEQ